MASNTITDLSQRLMANVVIDQTHGNGKEPKLPEIIMVISNRMTTITYKSDVTLVPAYNTQKTPCFKGHEADHTVQRYPRAFDDTAENTHTVTY